MTGQDTACYSQMAEGSQEIGKVRYLIDEKAHPDFQTCTNEQGKNSRVFSLSTVDFYMKYIYICNIHISLCI